METSIGVKQNEQHEIHFLNVQLSAAEARHLLLSFINNRIEYHNKELFGAMVRNATHQAEHSKSLDLLVKSRIKAENLFSESMHDHLKINIEGKLNISF